MAKILLSFLGLGNPHTPLTQLGYDDAEYELPNGARYTTPLSQEAVAAFAGVEGVDRVVTLMTPKSKDRHQEELRRRLLALGFSEEQLVWDESIRDEQSGEDQWGWFRALVERVDRGDELIFDFTHGFRSVPIIFSSAINYIQRVKGVVVRHAFYGYLTNPGRLAEGDRYRGRVIDLVAFYQLNDWVDGVSALTRDANAGVLADLAERARAAGEGFMGFRSLGSAELVGALRDLTACIKEINMNEVPARASRALEVLKAQRARCEGPDRQLIEMVIDTFSDLGAAAGSGRYDLDYFAVQRALVDALVRHQLDMQAFTVMRELVGSIGMLGAPAEARGRVMGSSQGRRMRQRYGEVFVSMCQFSEKEWRFTEMAAPTPADHEALRPFWERLRALGLTERLQGFMPGLVKLRNGFDHAWTASGRASLAPDSSARYRDELFEVLDLLEREGVLLGAEAAAEATGAEAEAAEAEAEAAPHKVPYSEDPSYLKLLKQYRALALEHSFVDKHERARGLYDELLQRFPEAAGELKALCAEVEEVTRFLNDVYRRPELTRLSPDALRAAARRFPFPGVEQKALRQQERARQRDQRAQEERALVKQGKPLTRVKQRAAPTGVSARPTEGLRLSAAAAAPLPPPPAGLHANDVRALSPRASWSLLVDETGSDFMEGEGPGVTAVVSLLIPEGGARSLPPLSRFHATESDLEGIDAAAQAVLDADVGVLGLSLDSLPRTTQDRWLDGVLRLVELNLRLMPLEGPARVRVLVENRPPFVPANELKHITGALRAQVMASLARSWPERARLLSVELRLIDKNADPRNGYVDAVAFTWGSSARHSKARLKASGWLNTCLLTDDAEALMGLWDQLDAGGGLPPRGWLQLATRADAAPEGRALAVSLLTLHAETCRADAARWRRLAEAVSEAERDKELSLEAFGRAVEWLERSRPAGERLSPPLELRLLTLRLARANHTGEVLEGERDRRYALARSLVEEDARLVVELALHEAVGYTNAFDFSSAAAAIGPWLELEPWVPGLRLWGRMRSSAGQHAAFEGRHAEAARRFEEALGAFGRLSHDRAQDMAQTSVYRAIALMDDAGRGEQEVEEAVWAAFGHMGARDLREALALCERPGAQFLHHLLLRWLACRPSAARVGAYLSSKALEVRGREHPWQLIEALRALLLARAAGGVTADAREALERACGVALSSEQGSTVRLIGAALRVAAAGWGAPWAGGEETLSDLARELPRASAQLALLRAGHAAGAGVLGGDPVEGLWRWLGSVLAFNYR